MAFIVPFIPYIVGAVGAVYTAKQQANASEYRAQVDENNATLTRQQTAAEEEGKRRQMAVQMGSLRASAIETGFDANTGSLATLQAKTAGEMELDVLTSRYRGELEAIGLQQDADMGRSNAKAAMTSGYLSAFGSLASGGANYLSGSKIPEATNYGLNNSQTGEQIRGRR